MAISKQNKNNRSHVKAAGGGLLRPLALDIVLGRGGMANNHPGNHDYREIIDEFKVPYLYATKRKETEMIIQQVFRRLKAEGRRFVEKADDDTWVEADPKKVRRKVAQNLREGAPTLRMELATARAAGGAVEAIKEEEDSDFGGGLVPKGQMEVSGKGQKQEEADISDIVPLDPFKEFDDGMWTCEMGDLLNQEQEEVDNSNVVPLDPFTELDDSLWSCEMGELLFTLLDSESYHSELVASIDQVQGGDGASVVSVDDGDWP